MKSENHGALDPPLALTSPSPFTAEIYAKRDRDIKEGKKQK